jgi:Animal haem peroxidase
MKDGNGDDIKDEKGNAMLLDLAAVDIMRDRERGVPRYNQFRQLLHRPPVKTFSEITSNRVWAQELSDVYGGDVNRVDVMVGMFAEDLPAGFGFSDTAFRVFILMASRRLKSDRFFSTDYRPEIYTPAGLKWIDENDMQTVLLRHYPELRPALREVGNAFAPWRIIA